ncbi:MAG: hypothetical protein ACFFDF_23515 [Candidatus Odinarchaeota archaeon]
MEEYIGKLHKVKKMLSDIVEEGNELIPNQEYLMDQERIDTFSSIFKNIDVIEGIFKRYYYKYKRNNVKTKN